MRALPIAFVLSAGLNASAVAWVATQKPDRVRLVPHPPKPAAPEPAPEPHDPIVPPAAPDEPVDVVLLDEREIAALETRAADLGARASDPKHETRIALQGPKSKAQSPKPGGAELPGQGSEPPPSDGSGGTSLLRMRGPEISQGPSQAWTESFLANSKPVEPEAEPTGNLAPSGNGTYRVDDGPYTMHVARDGSVKFEDKPNLHVALVLPTPKKLGKGIASWAEDPQKESIENGAKVTRPGEYKAMSDDDKPNTAPVAVVPVLAGGFDATDAFMRAHGQDPYFSRKLKMLDATRDERAAIRAKHDKDRLAHASEIVQGHLDRLWATTLDPAARKQALFELWEECAEGGSEDLAAAGARARAQVIGFIRAKLPEGSAGAFTRDEIERLDAHRRSTAHFVPYP